MDLIINSNSKLIPKQTQPLVSEGSALLNFLHIVGYDACNPPVAQVLKHTLELEGNWYILSPMHWDATHNDAYITELQLSEEQAIDCFQGYAKYLAEEGLHLHYYNATTWLLQVTDQPAIHAKPLHKLVNQSLMPELHHLDTSLYWQKFFTEAQMFFASQTKSSPINGVWVWGSAPLSAKKSVRVCADNEWISVAQMGSDTVSLYDPSLTLSCYSIVLINHLDVLSSAHQDELQKKSLNWYWNNQAYQIPHINWLTRLWRTLIHAN